MLLFRQKDQKMKIQLISCDAARPDKRAIAKLLEDIATGMDSSLAQELTNILVEGTSVDIEVSDKKSSSATRSLRKLSIDYELID